LFDAVRMSYQIEILPQSGRTHGEAYHIAILGH
jgi:hypothetical protein